MGDDGDRADESMLPGPQGRIVVALLIAEHRRAVTKHELADVLWGDELPESWERSLRVLVSKVRAALEPVSPAGEPLLRGAFGTYQMFLPRGSVVDLDAARRFAHDAESALAAGEVPAAGAAALVTQTITARPFLPGIDNPWVDTVRRDLSELRARALIVQAEAALSLDDAHEAIRCSERVLKLDPYRERAVQLLMRACAATSDTARAHAAYATFERRLDAELDAAPSAETRRLHDSLARPSSRPH